MKKALAMALVFVFALSFMVCGTTVTASVERAVTTEQSTRAAGYTTGDLNDDGVVNNRDLALLQQYINDWEVTINEAAADTNGNGEVNNRDLALLQQYVNKWDVELAPSSPSANEVLTQVPAELSGTKITMQIWWRANKDDIAEAQTFTDQTGIEVVYQTADLNKYQSNLIGKVTGGNPPALAAIINEWYPVPITRGLMQPVKNTGWDYSDDMLYSHAMMDQFAYKGEWYGIALKGSVMSTFEVMFFNKTMMAEDVAAGTDPYSLWKKGQWNWGTCLELAKKYTDVNKDKYGLTLMNQYYWMLSAGQDFVLSDSHGLKNNINSAKVLDAWYFAWDMINAHKVIPTDFSDQQKLFFESRVPMLGGGSYYMQCDPIFDYVPQNMKDDWGVVPFPSPKGQAAVAGCEGTVWGFPTGVKGKQLQAAMWYLRYYLDDYNYGDRAVLANENCWEVTNWMWNQKIQSYNSAGVLSYGGKLTSTSIQYYIVHTAATKAQVKTNLVAWEAELDEQISKIMNEF